MKIIMWKGRVWDKTGRVRDHRFYPPDCISILGGVYYEKPKTDQTSIGIVFAVGLSIYG